jgi:hypothetical protein
LTSKVSHATPLSSRELVDVDLPTVTIIVERLAIMGTSEMAPEPILRAALHVMFWAAVTTRNWTLNDDVSRRQINDLWEAIHEIPDLLCRWRDDSEAALLSYLDEYDGQWPSPRLHAIYLRVRNDPSA